MDYFDTKTQLWCVCVDAAKEDLMLFLENVRSKSEKLGEIAMKQAHQQYSLSLSHGLDDGFDAQDPELESCCSDLVDFSPVYRCSHIFNALGQREYFEQYYRKVGEALLGC